MPARLFVLAGVNGAGKSSLGGAAIQANGAEFFNPDIAAARLREQQPGLSAEQANGLAWTLGRRGVDRALAEGLTYALETTLGGTSMTRLLLDGARDGAEVHVWYAGLATPELHLRRIQARVAAGGHDIPEAKVRERFDASRANLVKLMPHLASLHVYDNSFEADPRQGRRPQPVLLLQMQAGRVVAHAPLRSVPAWAKPLLAAALR
ncbi:AAA family ATPase [Pelomonas sp. Root1444]|uniref:AAA family ATPase n=1 Tax=Pelomonas sp. Root1444 TaxID=1736464 RepID=UPI0007038EEA|nr:AAA family ATPase [Pelomonas sp. Root1444]KQY88787.1 ZTL protein [Pelomonas sp. Root1444]